MRLYHRDANGTDGESGPVSMSGSTWAGQPLLSPLPAELTCLPGLCCPAGHLLCPPLPWRSGQLPIPLERLCGFRQKGYFPVFIPFSRKTPLPAPTLSSLAAGLAPVGSAAWPWHPLAGAALLPPIFLEGPHSLGNVNAGRFLQPQSSGNAVSPPRAPARRGHPGCSGHALPRAGAADPGRSFSIVPRPG